MQLFRLSYAYLRLGLQNELQYRANFFVQTVTSTLEVGAVDDPAEPAPDPEEAYADVFGS